jgi:phosphoribosylformylglycinamidine cyclo-ligase
VNLSKLIVPEVFAIIQRYGNVPDEDMLRTFNMGVGITLVADPDCIPRIREHLAERGCESYIIGTIVEGEQDVRFVRG